MPDQPTAGGDQPRAVVCLTIEVEITDPDRLLGYAQKRCLAEWGETAPANDIAACAYEVLLASREGPSLAALGLELVDAHQQLIGHDWEPQTTRCAALRNRSGASLPEESATLPEPDAAAASEQLAIGTG